MKRYLCRSPELLIRKRSLALFSHMSLSPSFFHSLLVTVVVVVAYVLLNNEDEF